MNHLSDQLHRFALTVLVVRHYGHLACKSPDESAECVSMDVSSIQCKAITVLQQRFLLSRVQRSK